MRPRAWILGLIALALSGTPSRARAQPSDDERLQVVGASACPSPQAVQSAIFQLTSQARRRALPSVSRVVVTDEGERYRVDVTAEETMAARTYRDAARDCERRARFAAVFAVLTLMPPELQPEPEAETETEPETETDPRPAPASPPTRSQSGSESEPDDDVPASPRARRAVLLRLELTAAADRGAPVVQDAPSFGGELRAALGRGAIAGLATVGYFPRAELADDAFVYVVRRVPASLGGRARWTLGSFELSADAGLAALFVRTQGVNLVRPAEDTATAVGLRAGLGVGLPLFDAVGAVVGAQVYFWPSPPELEAAPRGDAGTLPAAWFGLSLGMSLGF